MMREHLKPVRRVLEHRRSSFLRRERTNDAGSNRDVSGFGDIVLSPEVYRNDGVEITFDALTDGKRVSGNFAQHYISSDGRMLYGNNVRFRTAQEANLRIAWHYEDDGWSVELFAPYAEILRATPKEKWAEVKKIKANFHRYHRYANGYRFNASWRTNFKGNNRDTSTFGDIVLPDPIKVK